ncbi:MAG: hypothetical protein O2970_11945 [Proteobacteria bacterium]|nr:hypothetical protein [Pseudomonadota bacterium]MDA0967649.1 hypothetical protein [Pseudomonadota bacterium]MDG4544513.1 hypothetical protein [Rickettsiales bacterium]
MTDAIENYTGLISPKTLDSQDDKWDESLKRAWHVRDFEIELFWKRSTYFSVLVGALFIAYYTLVDNQSEGAKESIEIYKLIISLLGFIASLVWFLSNKGSKFWQENWELHIDMIEKMSICNKIHSVVLNKSDKCWDLGAASYSVSRLNTLFSLIVCLGWFLVIIFLLLPIELINSYQKWIGFFLVIISIPLVLWGGKSKIKKSYNKSSMLSDGTIIPAKQDIITVYHK